MHCPLCRNNSFEALDVTARPAGSYWLCFDCHLLFKEPSQRLTAAAEKSRYEEHINGGEGHRRFLEPVRQALRDLPLSGSRGLDWGSGPEPLLSRLLSDDGYQMSCYDPFFGPPLPTDGPFDFITLTEVIEHFFEPVRDLEKLISFLGPGGYLVVMTDPVPESWWDMSLADRQAWFGSWAYRRDLSHVSFFSDRCFARFEDLLGIRRVSGQGRINVFQRPLKND